MKTRSTVTFFTVALGILTSARGADLTLWYDRPAKTEGKSPGTAMNETLPVGNGRIGGLVFGETARERVVLNEDSLWTGSETQEGSYQTLGDLFIDLPGHEQALNYRRDLDVGQSLAHVSYDAGGVKFGREYFCSHPADVLVIRLTADHPGSYTGDVELKDAHQGTVAAGGNRVSFAGVLNNGLKYETQVAVVNEGGTLHAADGKVVFEKCDGLTLVLAAGTDYVMDYAKRYRGEPPHARVTRDVDAASGKPYDALKAEHEKDFHSLFDRVSIDLGRSSDEQRAQPTGVRKGLAAKATDPELEALLFQYGRYLLISCSRPGGLPANLQGLWNDSNNAPWGSDYHANINVQMNYWPAEPTNLAECHLPFFDLILSQLESWRKISAASKDLKTPAGGMTTRGFALRTSHNIYGEMDWKWDKTANAWYCQHLWEHYAFGGDKTFLRDVAYPVMKETCEFWEDHLKPLPDGRLVVPNGWSPEHGPEEDGVSYNQEIVWDLFNNTADACAALGVDPEYQAKLAAMRDKLAIPKIGKWGQLQEWMTDRDDPKDHHRHTSHLFGVYPGRQISLAKTPELAAAAKKSLDARGPTGDVREWSFAWRTALYARLHDAEDAHAMVMRFFPASCLNLFGNHPPMQMDGDFGMSAGIAEMLVQSHEGEINLLPALPAAWPAGSVEGLRARGGFDVDVQWKDGKLTAAVIHGVAGRVGKVRYGSKLVEFRTAPGEPARFDAELATR